MSRKTIYYHDPLHDDFAPTNGHIRPKPIGADFPYEHPSPVWQALAFVVYRLIMTPFLFLYCKLVFGLRIENRKVLRELPGGYFLYGNHTNTLADAFIPTLLAFPRRANIVTAADTVSIPGVRNIVQMLGAVPLADTIDGTRQFLAAIHRRLERRQAVMIYPEAHIWPYYNGIRPFPDTAFAYPVREQVTESHCLIQRDPEIFYDFIYSNAFVAACGYYVGERWMPTCCLTVRKGSHGMFLLFFCKKCNQLEYVFFKCILYRSYGRNGKIQQVK